MGERVTPDGLDHLYDAFRQPRDEREQLPLLGPDEARAYIASVRSRVDRALDLGLLDEHRAHGEQQLLRDSFVVGLVVQHEHQHVETILQARQAMGASAAPLAGSIPTERARPSGGAARGATSAAPRVWCSHPGGSGTIGTSIDAWAYDNERPAHEVTLAPFEIARDPVTNREWLEFIADGGYERRELWHADGWRWAHDEEQAAHPLHWEQAGDGSWVVLRFGRRTEVVAAEPVQHISYWEADAFARWAGARLPTEFEW